MKKLLFGLLAMTVLISCDKEEDMEDMTLNCSIEGRWQLEGFDNTLFQFENGLRYTIYSDTPGVFGPKEEAIPNPHEYTYEEGSLVIDLNFGNFSTTRPTYKCECNVVELVDESGSGSILYKEGYSLADCDE